MAKIYPSLSPKFSRADLAGFLKLLDDDSLLLCSVYIAHEEKQREQSRFHLAVIEHKTDAQLRRK